MAEAKNFCQLLNGLFIDLIYKKRRRTVKSRRFETDLD